MLQGGDTPFPLLCTKHCIHSHIRIAFILPWDQAVCKSLAQQEGDLLLCCVKPGDWVCGSVHSAVQKNHFPNMGEGEPPLCAELGEMASLCKVGVEVVAGLTHFQRWGEAAMVAQTRA